MCVLWTDGINLFLGSPGTSKTKVTFFWKRACMGTRLGEGRKTNVGKLHVHYNAQ